MSDPGNKTGNKTGGWWRRALLRRRHRPRLLTLPQRVACFLLTVVPVLVLGVRFVQDVEARLDVVLQQAAPLASAELTRSLGHEVRIGGLSPSLSVRTLLRDFFRRDTLGVLPVQATDIAVASGATLADSPELASARSVVAYVSVPKLLAGATNESVTQVIVGQPRLLVVRSAQGRLNLQDLFQPKPGAKAGKPFVTRVVVEGGALRFVDFASKVGPPGRAETNELTAVNAVADLGARSIRFDASARSRAGTATARRLSGPLRVSGSVARGKPGEASGPDAGTAAFLANLNARDADAAYWFTYFAGQQEALGLRAARGDARVALVAPRPERPDAPAPPLRISVDADVQRGELRPPVLKGATVENARGRLRFAGGDLALDLRADLLGEPVTVTGSVFGVQRPEGSPPAPPGLALRVAAPRIPLQRAAALAGTLPANVTLGGLGAVDAYVGGSPNDPVLIGSVRAAQAGVRDALNAQDITARVTFAGGVLALSDVSARVGGGGRIAGRATARLATTGSAGLRPLPAKQLTFAFSGSATEVPLSALPLRNLPNDRRLRLAGVGDADFVGKRENGVLSAAANVSVDGLRVGDIPFTAAAARVQAEDGGFVVSAARLVSPAGSVAVEGSVNPAGPLALTFTLNGLDIGRLGAAFGVPEAGGFLSARGTVTGSVARPRVVVRSLAGMNLRYRTFAADTLTAQDVILTREGLTIPEEEGKRLTVRRFPAEVDVAGTVTRLLPEQGRPFDPVMALNVGVRRLDYQQILDQLPGRARETVRESVTAASTAAPAALAVARGQDAPPAPSAGAAAAADAPPFSGSIRRAALTVRGPVRDPVIRGDAFLGRLTVAGYPLRERRQPRAPGQTAPSEPTPDVEFVYEDGQIALTSFRLAASVGEVTGKATITRSGYVYGAFDIPTLDLAPLSLLTEKVASLKGVVRVSGFFSGTRQRPIVTVNVAPSDIEVAGTPLSDVTVTNLRYIANLEEGRARLELPSASFRQGDTHISVGRTAYDVRTRQINTRLSVDSGDIGVFLNTLRRSGLSETEAGAAVVRAINQLPTPIGGSLPVLEATVSGTLGGRGTAGIDASLNLRAETVQVGRFVADAFVARATLRNDVVQIDQFAITSGETVLRAAPGGTVDLNGDINVTVETNSEASLDLVRAFVPSFPLQGNVELVAVAQGPLRRPRVTASLDARNLVVALTPPAASTAEQEFALAKQIAAGVKLPDTRPEADGTTSAPPPPSRRVLRLDRLRIDSIELGPLSQADQESLGLDGGTYIAIPGARITREGGGEMALSAYVPFAYDPSGVAPERPLRVRAEVPQQSLAALSGVALEAAGEEAGEAAKGLTLEGTAGGNVSLTGTLREPVLNGRVALQDGKIRLPQRNGRDVFNPIDALNLSLNLSGAEILVDGRAALGAPNGEKGEFGVLNVGGRVFVRDLQDLLSTFRRQRAGSRPTAASRAPAEPFGTNTTLALTVTADALRPVGTDLLNRGEAFRTRIDGTLEIGGTLGAPKLTTPRPIRVADTRVQLPTRPGPDPSERRLGLVNPEFDMTVVIADKASIQTAGALRLSIDLGGRLSVAGTLADPVADGRFRTLGGYLQYATAYFRIQKDGEVEFRYQGQQANITFDDVVATTPSRVTRMAEDNPRLRERYKVTATLNGPLALGEDVDRQTEDAAKLLSFTSDPPLPESEIIALIGNQQQIEAVARGDVNLALRSGFEQVLQSSVLPGLFAPLGERLAFSLGLEEFGVDYAPDAPVTVRLSKRLPDPLDAFLLSYSRSLNSGGLSAGEPLPFSVSLLYEFYEVRGAGRRYVPRISVGISTNEQRDHAGFLRATVNY
jgi:Uncharacterized protein conserved in bacteria